MKYSPEDEAYLTAKGAGVMATKTTPGNIWAWQAYIMLRKKVRGMDGGEITVSDVQAYCEFIGLSDTIQKTRLARIVLALDRSERANGHPSA